MRIAIIDDIDSEHAVLRRQTEAQLERFSLDADIFDYGNGADFLSACRENHFDLVFLDIYMTGENGMDIARMLRQFDPDCLLVFTTSSTDHALEAFRVRAMHYLVKPYSDTELEALFEEIIRRSPSQERYLEVHTTDGSVRLRLKEILYAEHYRHQIYIYTTDRREIITRQTFRKFTNALQDDRFFLCSRGVLVNLEHAADFTGTEFVLTDGSRAAVSRDLIKNARSAFGNFLFERRS